MPSDESISAAHPNPNNSITLQHLAGNLALIDPCSFPQPSEVPTSLTVRLTLPLLIPFDQLESARCELMPIVKPDHASHLALPLGLGSVNALSHQKFRGDLNLHQSNPAAEIKTYDAKIEILDQ